MVNLNTRSALDAAFESSRPSEVVDGVKQAVIQELKSLDPYIDIETTEYFNHTFVPDLVVNWKELGKDVVRPVYLRFSLRAALMSGDVPSLAEADPILLTLADDNEERVTLRGAAAVEFPESSNLLLTDVSALDYAVATDAGDSTSPLLQLVKNNIVRGGRGHLDEPAIVQLTSSAAPQDSEAGEAAGHLAEFRELAERLFSPSSAFQLQRASDVLRVGLSEDAGRLLAELDSQSVDSAFAGNLSTAELQSLLPFLLGRSDVTRDEGFWTRIGSMMNLRRLEEMSTYLDGLDLTPLVLPNLANWESSKAQLVSLSDDEALPPDAPISPWRIQGRLLSAEIENWRLIVSHGGQSIRGRNDSISARWVDLAPRLSESNLSRVQLRGATRVVDIGTSDADSASGNVMADAETIVDGIGEDFFVPMVETRVEGVAGNGGVIASDFTKMVASASPAASVSDLASHALRILGYRYPPSDEALSDLLGLGEFRQSDGSRSGQLTLPSPVDNEE